jgi:hypothetical protein
LVKKVEFLRKQDDCSWNMQTRLCSRWNFSSLRIESKARKHTEELFRQQFYEVKNMVVLDEIILKNNFWDDLTLLNFVSRPELCWYSERMRRWSKNNVEFSSELRLFDQIVYFLVASTTLWVSALMRRMVENNNEYHLNGVISTITTVFFDHRLILSETQKSSGWDTKSNNLSCHRNYW